MKRLVLVMFSIVLLVSLAFGGGCAKPTPAPAPEGTPTAEETPAAEKVIELKFNDWGPPGIGVGKIHEQAAQMIEERTGGRVKVTPYFSQSLLQYADTYKGLAAGVADISLYVMGATPGVHDLNMVFLQLQTGAPSFDKTAKIYQELLDKFPALQEEMEKTNGRWLSIQAMPPNQIHTINKPVRVPEDMKGMKILASEDRAKLVNSIGGAAIAQGPPDWYTSLERGLAEGQIVHWAALNEFKIQELFNYHTHLGEGGTGTNAMGYVINLDTWNSLSPDVQEILVDVYQWASAEAVKYDLDFVENAIKEAKEAGHTFIELTPEEIQLWGERMQPIVEEWITKTEAKGWPAREVYEGLQQLIAEYK